MEPNEVIGDEPFILVDPDMGIGGVQVGGNPKKLENHRAVLEYMEKNVLADGPSGFESPTQVKLFTCFFPSEREEAP